MLTCATPHDPAILLLYENGALSQGRRWQAISFALAAGLPMEEQNGYECYQSQKNDSSDYDEVLRGWIVHLKAFAPLCYRMCSVKAKTTGQTRM